MKRFKNFLMEALLDDGDKPQPREQTNTKTPLRRDFEDTEEGQAQYVQALKDAAPKLRQEAQAESEKNERTANLLGNLETGLKIADQVADVALTAGSVIPPGAAINAAVKGVKGAVAAKEGDYMKAGANVLDAAIPYAGKAAMGIKGVSNVVKAISDPVGLAAAKLPAFVGIGQIGAKVGTQMGLEAAGVKAASKAVESGTTKLVTAAGEQIAQAGTTNNKKPAKPKI